MMFKHFFASGENEGKIIGFKEIRFRQPEQLDFVRSLCQNSKIVFQFHTNIRETAQKGWYRRIPNSRANIRRQIAMFKKYHTLHPNDTYISTLDDFKKPNFVQNLYEFLDVSLEGVNIDIQRLYKISLRIRAKKQARKKRKKHEHWRDHRSSNGSLRGENVTQTGT
eukprot:TRINITY_DN4022_c2_g1_i6.p3 TRINITY_DN4022_c2_g1~~TRINITY_DN4022_c2_g1_i6.p3  ORF type:complete len:166 (+),score=12.36 TRINITY_DN4022_c2_g1_i6:83-580(+)